MDGKQKLLTACLLICIPFATQVFAYPNYAEYERNHLLNKFYAKKVTEPHEAEAVLRHLLAKHPNDVHALKEMGYWMLLKDKPEEALLYFQRASNLAPNDYALHAQLGYLYAELRQVRKAYYQFADTAHSPDPELQEQSRQAMINLGGTQFAFLHDPFFADVYLAPSYLSRFTDTIIPWDVRAGLEYGEYDQLKLYAVTQGNYDSQSRAGEVPIIYSDNYTMLGVGIAYQPWQLLPLYTFAEAGKSYVRIINQGQDFWQDDFRLGVYSYKDWGAKPKYNSELTWSAAPLADFYGSFEYYSRYDHDWIGQARVRPGLRVLQYHYSSIDIYLKGELFADSKEIYYNNILLGGAGMVLTPDNRWPVEFRVEGLRGMYIPTPDSDQNPYDKYYNTLFAEMVIYFEL